MSLKNANSIADLRAIARRRVPRFVFEYIDSGVEGERTLARNTAGWADIQFAPRTLVDTGQRSQAVTVFGRKWPTPMATAPTGFNAMAHSHGDIHIARAAARAGIPFSLSSFSNATLEDVAAAAGVAPWLQLYVMEDFSITEALIERARAAGSEALLLTTDANVHGLRERLRRCYRKPGALTLWHLLEAALHPRWLAGLATGGKPTFANLAPYLPPHMATAAGGPHMVAAQLRPTLTWEHVARIRALWPGKLIVKGILRPDDALRARDAGADGLVVTNHGGRQLEDAITSLQALPGIRQALGPGYPVFVDSGIRRGGDVIKAVALGATAVMLGRAPLWGLAAGGEAGAAHAIGLLVEEIDRNLGMLGCNSLQEVTPDFLRAAPGLL